MAQITAEVLSALDPHHVSAVMSGKRTNEGGYPTPGQQMLTATSAMSRNCFVDDNTWRLIAENGEFDDIVVGSGFCALAYIDQALRQNRHRKILLLDRGGFWLPDHFQNLPLPFQFAVHSVSETFPWELTHKTAQSGKYLSGSSPFFGGRSSFWSIWSPRAVGPDFDLMDDFPESMKQTALGFYDDVDKLLHIKPANQIDDPVFQVVQGLFDKYLQEGLGSIKRAVHAEPARLATGVPVGAPTRGFRQFSAVGPLLEINGYQNELAQKNPPAGRPVMIATDAVVKGFEVEPTNDDNKLVARVLHTSRGPLSLRSGKTNVILATGVIPTTTILMNSIPDQLHGRAGSRLTAHFRSHIKGRFKVSKEWLGDATLPSHPVIAACHVRGRGTSKLQWHIQVNGSYKPVDKSSTMKSKELAHEDAVCFAGLAADYGTTLTAEQWDGSQGYIIVSCSTLGELPTDTDSWVKHNKSNPDVTTNVRLQIDVTPKTAELWNETEESTFDAVKVIASKQAPLSSIGTTTQKVGRLASALYMAKNLEEDKTASVDLNYRPYGLEAGNVYVTGAGLLPTAGSWNPTPTICGYAQDLAKKLVTEVA
ncbi:hypothetical protein DL96DRAFT_1714521 [Flagelloscypha sp. PMI_526]|nr:hypothetical protein DL96DRAFT_1714521 [Flagelloscypha sp. PMI_526]